MNSQVALFAMLAFAAIFSLATPMDYAIAESVPMPDGEGGEGEYEGKSCPSKEKKSASFNTSFNI